METAENRLSLNSPKSIRTGNNNVPSRTDSGLRKNGIRSKSSKDSNNVNISMSSASNNNNSRINSTMEKLERSLSKGQTQREKFQTLLKSAQQIQQNQEFYKYILSNKNLEPDSRTSISSSKPGTPLKPRTPSLGNSRYLNLDTIPKPTSQAGQNSDGAANQKGSSDNESSLPGINNNNANNKAALIAKSITESRGKSLRAFVEKAIMDHKVFTCVGVYPAVKNALKRRGWVEKNSPLMIAKSFASNTSYKQGVEEESDLQWIARNLKDYPPDFIWVIRRDNIDWRSLTRDQLINRYPRAYFTTKVGLTACLQQMHWFSEDGVSETFYPRCYRICQDDERLAFQEDYRITACMGFLRYFMETYETSGHSALRDPHSKITPLAVDFAARQLGNYVRMRRHEDIDWLLPPNFMSQHWDAFIHQYYMVVHDKKKIRFETEESVQLKYELAKKTMQRMMNYWPQGHLDGVYNMWICKPGARSRGKGIVIMNSLEKILELLNQGGAREANWVVQKYIERPLLIYKTKSDIRQWFLITDWAPLTLWFYKDSYVRFSTKPFVLEDFHESIHLTNNAVQVNYKNAEGRDPMLPEENMWDNQSFQAYLRTIGKPDEWDKIYKGMQRAIIGVLLASQETTEPRRNCFELYGADFMLAEDLTPWLIEINSCPCMAGTTSVTARLCAACLEDTVKVVIDRKQNKNCDTGSFELIYRQPLSAVTVQHITGHDLVIHGRKISRDYEWSSILKHGATKRANTAYNATSSFMNQFRNKNVNNYSLPINPNTSPSKPTDPTFNELLRNIRLKSKFAVEEFLTKTQTNAMETLASANQTLEESENLLDGMKELQRRVGTGNDAKFDIIKSNSRTFMAITNTPTIKKTPYPVANTIIKM